MVVAARPAQRGPRRRYFVIALVVLAFLSASFIANFYTDVLWFNEVDLSEVLWTTLGAQFLTGLVVAVVSAAFVWVNLWLTARTTPVYRSVGVDPVERYRDLMAPNIARIRLLIAGVLGFFIGAFASSRWETYLLWLNRVDVGQTDPQFGKDIGFYLFELPLWDTAASQASSLLFLTVIAVAAAHVFHGAVGIVQGQLPRIAPRALGHISVLLGLLALVKAAQYAIGAYQLNFSPRGVVTGASYTDVHAQLPALRLLAIISIISAVLFFANTRVRRLSLPLAAVGIWVLTAFLAGGVWPAVVQRFSVEPQEPQRERPYIERNIAATRDAFGLADVKTQTFAARSDLEAADVEANSGLLRNVRLWDPSVLQQAYEQLQAIRTYYEFPDVDIDRYTISGETRQVLLSARELSIEDLPESSRKWANLHLQYTHGYGVVASLANASTVAGQPSFLVKDVPGTIASGADELEAEQPRIYFGEAFDDSEYSIVNSDQEELDYESDEGVQRSRYEGEGGIEMGGLLRKIAFALRAGDPNFVLSGLINPDSRVLIYRNVRDRVARAAPFLALDSDPYPVVAEGRLIWLLDGYTTSPWYPYSQRYNASEVIPQGTASLSGDINYVRNSVKIAVDAYDGSMTFYVIDDTDPLIRAWRNVYPGLFSDEEPPDSLREHFRYPEDLFKLQTEVYRTYHIEDPLDFYSKQDEWSIADRVEIVNGQVTVTGLLDPTYLLMQVPGGTEQEFVITRPFTPRARPNMVSFMLARSDPDNYGEIVNLQFPRQTQVNGPVQVDNLINQDVEIARELTLLGQRGSETRFGSLVTLPIEDSVLYVQPLFVIAENGGIPELKRVFVVLGERVVMEDTFSDALAALFDVDLADVREEDGVDGDGTGEEDPDEAPRPDADTAALQRTLAEAAEIYERAQAALAAGDFEEYGRLIEELGELLQDVDLSERTR